MGTPTRALAIAVAAVALAAACGGPQGTKTTPESPADDTASQEVADTATEQVATDSPAAPSEEPQTSQPALVARSDGEVEVHPETDAPASHVLPATTSFGSPRAVLVVEERGDWLKVQLPERPNGSTGWVRRDGLELRTVHQSIEIDLEARTLTLFDRGEEVVTTPVAIGTPDNPTPIGEFYVVDKLAAEDPDGAYGPFAFGLSAYSDTLTEFAGGDGQVGIHGTNDPSSIGHDVSHGCIRLPNEVAEILNDTINLGTPVTIR
jgi:lipoprotein-anchoring transpeptidase ErfK/SrfK